MNFNQYLNSNKLPLNAQTPPKKKLAKKQFFPQTQQKDPDKIEIQSGLDSSWSLDETKSGGCLKIRLF